MSSLHGRTARDGQALGHPHGRCVSEMYDLESLRVTHVGGCKDIGSRALLDPLAQQTRLLEITLNSHAAIRLKGVRDFCHRSLQAACRVTARNHRQCNDPDLDHGPQGRLFD